MRLVVVLTALSVISLLVLSALLLTPVTRAGEPTVEVEIDSDTTGNGNNFVGITESCNGRPLQVGDTIDVDVVVRGIPTSSRSDQHTGIGAFDFQIIFDPAVVQIEFVHMLQGPEIFQGHYIGGVSSVTYNRGHGNEDPPGTKGDTLVQFFPSVHGVPDGSGVLTRVTLKAIGQGSSRLDLIPIDTIHSNMVGIYDSTAKVRYLVDKSDATILVGGGSCAGPTPTAFPIATPGQLPGTGGPPGDSQTWPGLVGATLMLTVGGVILATARRRFR